MDNVHNFNLWIEHAIVKSLSFNIHFWNYITLFMEVLTRNIFNHTYTRRYEPFCFQTFINWYNNMTILKRELWYLFLYFQILHSNKNNREDIYKYIMENNVSQLFFDYLLLQSFS